MSFDMLNIQEQVKVDTSITKLEYHTHQPYASTSYNNNDEIRIPIQTQDVYTLPSQSFLYIEGKLLDQTGKASTTLSFINCGILFLFDEIRYELGGTVVDRVRNPGVTALMKGYVSYTENESLKLNNSGWSHLANPKLVDQNGNFCVCVPLKMFLGFAEDFNKIIVNTRQELILIRSTSDVNAIHTNKPDETPKIALQKILWKVPHVSVSDTEKLKILKCVDSGRDLDIPFRCWELQEYPLLQETMRHSWAVKTSAQLEKPRYIIFGFQTNRKNIPARFMSQFDHCNLTNIKLYLNSETYPYDNLNLNFDNKQWSILYEMYTQFQQSYYYKNQGEPCLSPENYLQLAPLVVIDCSRQNDDVIKGGAVDIRIEFETNKNIPANTSAYCLLLHDRLVKYNPLTSVVRIA